MEFAAFIGLDVHKDSSVSTFTRTVLRSLLLKRAVTGKSASTAPYRIPREL